MRHTQFITHLRCVAGCERTVFAADTLINCQHPDQYPLEAIAAMMMSGAPPGVLRLKIGARYMIIKNMYKGVFNGVRCQLVAFAGTTSLFVKLLSGPEKGTTILLPRCVFTISSESSGLPFPVRRRQFPLIPAFAVTIHKAQGQTLLRVGLYLSNPIFTHGQLYTALSRTRGWQHIVVYSLLINSALIDNCVYKNVLIFCMEHDPHEIRNMQMP
jgi:hypothetical protein